ncbi:Uma2 family endonuclease [Heyndrickxia sp. NPDC080065]|uniref:Uma2 family endonuclease n=1 Tax=Heyndrickxia sp. NPDC080065 TaxID=3390568 RepID=UPI003CFCCA16
MQDFCPYFIGEETMKYSLVDNNDDDKKVVIPDLSVICDKSGFTDQQYCGVPELIIEIVSPSNQAHDLIFKTNLYQKYKVKKYWIINPILNVVMVYSLGQDDQYELVANEKFGSINSKVIPGFFLDVDRIFN